MKGKVTLVGAGIGSSSLMTLGGLKALKNADVVVYDKRIGDGVYELIPENAEKINAGKEASNHLIPQENINDILIERAMEGKKVVRLKGGDSYLFGRGGEEAESLHNAGIEFEVIPGISSALAAPAYGGIPITHRSCSSSVHIFTGHSKNGEKPDINYKYCAEAGGTLVFLMGVKSLPKIVNGLIENGMPKDTPCAVIERGGEPFQKKVIGCLCNIEERADRLKSPAVIVVGQVCSYSDKLDWFSALPLRGKKVIITRPRERAYSLAECLREKGAAVRIAPVIKTEGILKSFDEIKELIDKSQCVAFTSPFGVRSVFEALESSDYDIRVFGNVKIGAVGEKTAAALLKKGIKADIVPKLHNGASLVEGIINEKCDNVLILRAEKGASQLTERLNEGNISFIDKAVYRTIEISVNVNTDDIDYVVFASPSEVRAFSHNKGNYKGICIGCTTKKEAEKMGISCIAAENTDDASIIKAIIDDIK